MRKILSIILIILLSITGLVGCNNKKQQRLVMILNFIT